MQRNLYTTEFLTGAINHLKPRSTFFSGFFPRSEAVDTDQIFLDESWQSFMVMPYSLPRSDAITIKRDGYATKVFRPAYLKVQEHFDPENYMSRLAGEALGGSLSPMAREQIHVMSAVKSHKDMYAERIEQMCAELATTGKLWIKGKGFEYCIDLKRDSSLQTDAVRDGAWNDEKTDIVKQIEEEADKVLLKSGFAPEILMMGNRVWSEFRNNPKIQKLMEIRRGVDISTKLTPEKAFYGYSDKGQIGDYRVIVHTGTYADPWDRKIKYHFPQNKIMLVSSGISGTKFFGRIKDRECKFKAIPYFAKLRESNDGSSMNLISQAAPLVLTKNINAASIRAVLAPAQNNKDTIVGGAKTFQDLVA